MSYFLQLSFLIQFVFQKKKNKTKQNKSILFRKKKMSFELINSKFKIPKLKKVETNNTTSPSNSLPRTNYPNVIISQTDMFRIFSHLTILFIGDNSMRTIYRDFVKIFSNGHLLDKTEAAMQHGEYRTMNGSLHLKFPISIL